jgi:hypothetical protein
VPPSLSSFAARLTELTETFGGHEFSASTARQLLATFDQDYADFEKFLVRRFPRLEEGQQHLLIEILMRAQATAYASLLQQWSRERALPLSIRAHALRAQESLGVQGDTAYRDALWHAEAIYTALSQATPSPLTDTGELLPTWCQAVLDLPLALAVDLAHALSPAQPQIALAVVQSLRPIVDAKDRLALIECLAEMTIPESVTVLLDFLRDTTDKALQKTIKRALHRLKAQGLTVDSDVQRPHTAMVGTVTHRLEKCLASHIDAAGDRVLWMIRTKAFGGYTIAYLVINYGTGIQMAIGLQASKRELPALLEKAQERVRLIELEPTYCQYQVALAHQMNLDTHTPVPEEFFAVRDIVGEATTQFERGIIYTVLSTADLQEAQAYSDHAADLLELPEFSGWTLPASLIQKYADQLREIEESQIIVSQALRKERQGEVYAHATEEALGAHSRRLMRLRLEEMAYYLWQTARRREALWAVAAAQSLQEDNPERLRRNPFAGALLERSIEGAKARPSSRIIQPFAR